MHSQQWHPRGMSQNDVMQITSERYGTGAEMTEIAGSFPNISGPLRISGIVFATSRESISQKFTARSSAGRFEFN